MHIWAFSSGRAQRWQLLCIHGKASLQAAQIAACEASNDPLQRLHGPDGIFLNKRLSQAACARIVVASQYRLLRLVFCRFKAAPYGAERILLCGYIDGSAGWPDRGDPWLAHFERRIGQLVVLVEFRLIVNRIG